jgi:hypothetical protein
MPRPRKRTVVQLQPSWLSRSYRLRNEPPPFVQRPQSSPTVTGLQRILRASRHQVHPRQISLAKKTECSLTRFPAEALNAKLAALRLYEMYAHSFVNQEIIDHIAAVARKGLPGSAELCENAYAFRAHVRGSCRIEHSFGLGDLMRSPRLPRPNG